MYSSSLCVLTAAHSAPEGKATNHTAGNMTRCDAKRNFNKTYVVYKYSQTLATSLQKRVLVFIFSRDKFFSFAHNLPADIVLVN